MTSSPDPTFEHRLRVRYGETDQMGVVHHANHLLYLEEARTAYLGHLGCSYRALEAGGVGLPVRRVELRYRAPAYYEDELAVAVRVARVGAATVTFAYAIRRPSDDREIADGSVELACVSLADRRPRPLPDELRAVLGGCRPEAGS